MNSSQLDRLSDYLAGNIDYDPDTGIFTFKPYLGYEDGALTMIKGNEVGWYNNGYLCFMIHGKTHWLHKLAWFIVNLEWPIWPNENVDHINRIRSDNRICNLRVCSRSDNQCNHGVRANNTSGYKGVTFHNGSGKWRSQIIKDKKHISIGLFKSPQDAARAYNEAALEHHGEFAYQNLIED